MNFSENLKLARKQQQLTQSAVADKLHVSRKTISSWENERSYPDITMLIEISKIYQLSLDTLIKGDLGMIKHYEKQAVASHQDNRIVMFSYYANIVLLLGDYLIRIKSFSGSGAGIVIFVWLINLILLATHYHDYSSWFTDKQLIWRFVLVSTVLLVLNLLTLAWFWPGQDPYTNGILIGRVMSALAATFSAMLVFLIQPSDLKKER